MRIFLNSKRNSYTIRLKFSWKLWKFMHTLLCFLELYINILNFGWIDINIQLSILANILANLATSYRLIFTAKYLIFFIFLCSLQKYLFIKALFNLFSVPEIIIWTSQYESILKQFHELESLRSSKIFAKTILSSLLSGKNQFLYNKIYISVNTCSNRLNMHQKGFFNF